MIKKTYGIFGIVSLSMFVACQKETPNKEEGLYHGKEAIGWLSSNKNEFALASNHFASTKNAVEFVNKLYKMGADSVFIPDSCIFSEDFRIKSEGGPYANCLSVVFPDDKSKWESIFKECQKELDSEFQTFNLKDELKDKRLLLWWD